MIAIAGGTGRLGRIVVERLATRGETVRILSRDPQRAPPSAANANVELVAADVRDPDAVERAVAGARIVISAMSAFGMKGVSPREVDLEGNAHLIASAEKHGVERFIFVSVLGASADHPMELARMKYRAEQRLIQSKLSWAILRPSTFIETFQEVICAPLLDHGKAMVFGRAQNPINFVSAYDVARFVELATTEPEWGGTVTEIGGAENLSLLQFVEKFSSAIGVAGPVKHIPRPAMRLLSLLARPFSPTFARMVQAGVLMDTTNMSFDPAPLARRYPQIAFTTVAEAARRDYASRVPSKVVTA
ncbi:MAG: nucleoside diphosphate sugar epimerase [Gemmatimonadetes bacterium]|nr:nucleoside diphosphate sugar epimerase [Gemmatimonadota bacterium]